MTVTVVNELHKFKVNLEAGDHIQIYINESPISKVDFTVATDNMAEVEFKYLEQLIT